MKTEIYKNLAICGGPKTISRKFKRYNPLGQEEVDAVRDVVESGILSQFIGGWGPDFFGGPKVREFENKCQSVFGVKHAVSVNSWTSGLIAAVGAIGTEPGDEIIVSPFTMCASATAILHWNAIPVFADIEAETFCIDPESVEKNISPFTKAIMAVDIFGHSANLDSLRNIATKYDLKIITDSAQAPGAIYNGKYAGTLADVGGFSLNYHKHIHTGEGGILVTENDEIANRLRLIRNHAEAVVEGMEIRDLTNMVGYNFRMGEIECAIGIEQLDKLPALVKRRQTIAKRLTEGLSDLEGLRTPRVKSDCTHSYYGYPLVLDVETLGVSRQKILDALVAEGIEGLGAGYVNVHLLPLFQRKIAFGTKGFPWTSEICHRDVNYGKGICPVAEELHDSTLMCYAMCMHDLSDSDVDLVVEAFNKVWSRRSELH